MKTFRSVTKAMAIVLVFALLLPLSATANAAGEKPTAPSVTANAAVVMDYDTGELLYAKDPDTMRVPASMVKVMTAYIVYEELAKGTFTLDTEVPITNNAANKSRDKANYEMVVPLPYNGIVTVGTLLRLMLIYSASASAIALGEFISGTEDAFVVRMNETAQRMGLSATYVNTHGHLYNYITARSQAELVRQFIHNYPEVLEITSETSVVFNGTEYKTTNYLLPGQRHAYEGVDGFKTGNTNPAGYCQAVTCLKDGKRLISVCMASSSGDTRATDNVKLLDYGYDMVKYLGKYTDISEHWIRPVVEELDSLGVELHTDGFHFLPDDEITRAEFTAMLYSALELKGALPDVVNGLPAEPDTSVDDTGANGTDSGDTDTDDTDTGDVDAGDDGTGADVPGDSELTPSDDDILTETNGTETETGGTETETGDAETEPGSTETETGGAEAEPEASVTVTCPFTDVVGTWSETYVTGAWSRGLVNGNTETSFDPDASISRQEVMVILDRALDLPNGNGLYFSDTGDIAFWALQSAARVTYAGLFTGSDGRLNPLAHMTRAEAAQAIERIVESL